MSRVSGSTSTMSIPKVSVVMPVYNAAAYLDEAVRSILEQTFRDFEFIIIDDGSTDATTSLLKGYPALDSRIRLHHQENKGVISALNRGCRLARGEYIARMDADDISLPHRLEKQLKYIEKHPQTGIVGTWIYNIDQNGTIRNAWQPPTGPKILEWTHFFGVCVSHPTVLMKRQVLERLEYYRPETAHIEDVDLWLRAGPVTQFGNVPEVLLKYRTWGGNVSHTRRQFARDSHVKRLALYVNDFLGEEVSLEAVAGLRQTRVGPPMINLRQIHLTAGLIQRLYKAFVKKNSLAPEEHREISWDAAKRVGSLALRASRLDVRTAVLLFTRALQLDYRILEPSTIMKGMKRGLQPS